MMLHRCIPKTSRNHKNSSSSLRFLTYSEIKQKKREEVLKTFSTMRSVLPFSLFCCIVSCCHGFSVFQQQQQRQQKQGVPANIIQRQGHHDRLQWPEKGLVQQQQRRLQQQRLPLYYSAIDLDDLECDTEFLDATTITTTFSKGTEESDIILTWEPEIAERIQKEALLKKQRGSKEPYMVGIVGNPGSGKTTSCFSLKELLTTNNAENNNNIGCFVMPFDGYHLPMKVLQAQPNAEDLIYRRGAPDTFDPEKLLLDIKRIKHGYENNNNNNNEGIVVAENIIRLPGFDHHKGDPEPDEHEFRRDEHDIVLVEGLYLFHDGPIWEQLKNQFDLTIFVNADVDVCMDRLKIRNQCIPGYTKEEIEIRCEVVDRTNAMLVERSKLRADICVDSAAQRTTMTTTISDGTPEPEIERTWEANIATKIRNLLEERRKNNSKDEQQQQQQQQPLMVSIVGGPGSGKTTSCHVLQEMLEDVGCAIVPFDGYHKPVSVLQQEPNAEDLLYRRGAPDTFDAKRLKNDLLRIRNGQESLISIPGFNYALGDPEENVHTVEPNSKHNVVLCEGLYLLHDGDEEWKDIKNVFDYSIFLNADVDACIERLKVRNKCVPGTTEEEIEMRCEQVDRVNANIIDRSKRRADEVVESVAQAKEIGLIVQ